MTYTVAELTKFFTNTGPGTAPNQAQQFALQAIANQNASQSLTDVQARNAAIALSANSTTAVSVETYQFFLGFSPSVAGLTALNAAFTGTGAQASLNQENRFIAQSVALATGNATAKATFSAAYGALSVADATAYAYNIIIGNATAQAAGVDVKAAVAYLSSAASVAYFTAFIKANTNLTSAADIDLAVKAAIVGEIMSISTTSGLGSYASATNNLLVDLADDGKLVADNAAGFDLFPNYGGKDPGGQKSLTNGTDVLTGNVFNALPVYTPGGNDRINSLQDDDRLTGTGTNPTLNVQLVATNDSSPGTITPKMTGIQTINADVQGNANTLDLRNTTGLTTLNVTRITSAGGGFTAENISDLATNLSVKDTSSVFVDVNFYYVDGILKGVRTAGETVNLALQAVNLENLRIGNAANNEGFETYNVTSTGTVNVHNLQATHLSTLKVVGSGKLNILSTTEATQQTTFNAGAITTGGGPNGGIHTIDLSGYSGATNLDVTGWVAAQDDPANSGSKFAATIIGGSGDDTFWTKSKIGGDSATSKVAINGGAGKDTIRSYNSITEFSTITGVEALELRNQGGGTQTADLSVFDASLASLLLRSENGSGSNEFTITKTSKALAESGNIVLQHPTDAQTSNKVNLTLADATGASDLVAVTVINGFNTNTTYNYELNIGTGAASGKVENVKVNDNDTESNVLTLTQAANHTGTVTLTGGTAGLKYEVASTLIAATVDASTQASDLSLKVGNVDQTIKLGTGNDVLTFDGLDYFTGADSVSDAGGTDTIRAAFSKSVTGAPTLNGIEKLQIVATDNVTIDAANITGVTELAILSDKAVDSNGEIFSTAVAGVDTTDIITLKNTTLTALNFFGDADGTNADGGDTNTTKDSGAYTQNFNGVTLENNNGATVAVNISAPLANGADSASAGDGIKAYNVGKLTTHGVQTLNIVVKNEYSENGTTVKAGDALTTIANIYDKNLVNFTVEAKGSVNVGIVSGNATGNNIKTFDVSKVGGNFTGEVVALGNDAVVTLAQGINNFNALGSAGNNVTITSFAGADVITGTSQNDTIDSGAGNDTVNGDRGDNVISVGAGDDIVTAKDGNNTIAFGTGTLERATINDNTGLDGTKATNVFTLAGTTALVDIDSNGAGASEVVQYIAVGAGSDLRIEWTGSILNESNALLDGSKAVLTAAATYNGDANSNLVLADTGEATTFNGGAGNDVLFLKSGVTNNVTFNGGDGNDAFVGTDGGDDLTGGKGADVLVLGNGVTAAAGITKIHIADGDSTATGWDIVHGFIADTAANFGTELDLAATTIAGATGVVNGTNTSGIFEHQVGAGGFISFDATADGGGLTVSQVGTGAGQISLASALAYLAANLNGTGLTVAFNYDRNGDGVINTSDDVIVFQDGASDTVVQLVGLATVGTALGTAAAANTILLT